MANLLIYYGIFIWSIDFNRMFEIGGLPPVSNYLFLGDYVDRANRGIETISLLLCFKIKYPENFFILRGNHECSSINRIYGFYDECKRRYSIKLWKIFGDVFNCLPISAIVDDSILYLILFYIYIFIYIIVVCTVDYHLH